MDRRQALAEGATLPNRTRGAVLMADISGFTPLTAALVQELGPQRGADELTRQLNLVYEALIAEVDRFGGSVIGFSGDAITCWFDSDDGRRAATCALAMQEAMCRFAAVPIPSGSVVELAMKAAIAAGPVRRFLVGDKQIHHIDVLAGATLDRLELTMQQALRGEVLLDPATAAGLADQIEVREWRRASGPDDHGGPAEHPPAAPDSGDQGPAPTFAVVATLTCPVVPVPWPALRTSLPEDAVRPWLLPPVYERLQSGQGQFLAELRPAAALFLRFGGIDYDTDGAGPQLDAYIRWVQSVLARYEGFLIDVTMGDKGSYLYAAFGAPLAHDDDPERAVAAALELRVLPPALAYIRDVQIGISRGRMRTGAYGGSTRRTYGVLGDEVNLAARLMQRAAPGEILVSGRIADLVNRRYELQELGLITVKGRAEPLPVARVVDRSMPALQRPASLFTHPLVGRGAELARIGAVLDAAQAGQGQVLRVEGVAGVGKSHLAAEVIEQAVRRGMQVALGACQSTTQNTAYAPWRQVFRALLGVPEEPAAVPDRAARLAAGSAAVESWARLTNPDWLPRLPLLGDLLGLPIEETASTAGLDPELRQGALFALMVEIVQTLAAQGPLLVLIEDVHWMDEASLGLIRALTRALARVPVVLALFHRPPLRADWALPPMLERLAYHHHLDLGELGPEGMAELIHHRLGAAPAPLTRQLIQERAQGNPFFAEELIDTLRETRRMECQTDGTWGLSDELVAALRAAGCLMRDPVDGVWVLAPDASLASAELGLPESIHGVVLSRVDRLPEAEKLTLKSASVIGRVFSLPVLAYAHPLQPGPTSLVQQIQVFETRDFVRVDTPQQEASYLFKHNITQEVTYATLLFDQRQQLHRTVAEWYEQKFAGEELASYYPLLVHHWHQAEDREREGYYAELAGRQAAAQFANEEAVTYLSRALELTPPPDAAARYRILLLREAVHDRRGARTAQAEDLATLVNLAAVLDDGQARATVALRQAGYAQATGDYTTALAATQRAVAEAVQAADPTAETAGYIIWGNVLALQGNYEAARALLVRAHELGRATGDPNGEAESLRGLGFIYLRQRDYPTAREYCEQAVTLFRTTGDRAGETATLGNLGLIYNTLGELEAARSLFEQALTIFREVGDRKNEGINQSNLGMVYQDLGDSAASRAAHEQALEICREIGDRQGEAVSLVNLGLVYQSLDDNVAARDACEQALAILREVGDRFSEAYSLNYLGHALAGLGDLPAAAAAYGQALAVRRELEQDALVMDTLAGQARIAWAGGDTGAARALVDEILAWVTAHGVEGIEEPLRVYWTCYEILTAAPAGAADAARAPAVLTAAHTLLQERAARIDSDVRRRQFLDGVAAHRAIGAAWAARPVA